MSNEDTIILAEDIIDFCNAVEAACIALKTAIAKNFGPEPERKEANALPGVDLSKLPFVSYKTKEPAKENEAGWIFSNTKGAEALLATLKSKDGRARFGSFDYQLQGAEKQFIARRPVKK